METADRPIFLRPQVFFAWPEYCVFVLVLISSMGIGVFFGFFSNRNKTVEEFLLAGRSMGILPVVLSLICTFLSSVILLGYPVEIYFYGTQFFLRIAAVIPLTLLLAYIYVPVYFRLRLTSAYEYFEWRFSRRVRVVCSISSILYLIVSMPATSVAPSLALDHVSGINMYASSAMIFIVCIAYSAMGGLKAVLYTNALQGIVIVVSVLGIIFAGVVEAGGVGEIIRKNSESNRLILFNFDLDPRTRHTVWSCIIGGTSAWLQMLAGMQAQIQRYYSVNTLKAARTTLVWNMIGMMCIAIFTTVIGMIMYAKYFNCDPVNAKMVDSPDQLLPLFVMDVLGTYPGLPGLFVAGLACGTLSTLSSAMNAAAATIIGDFVNVYHPHLDEASLTAWSKAISALSGIVAFVFFFPVAAANDTVQLVAFGSHLAGTLMGPIVGLVTLGMCFPWANELGVLLGYCVSVFICLFQSLGQILSAKVPNKLPDQRLFLDTSGCTVGNSTTTGAYPFTTAHSTYVNHWKERDDSVAVQIWSISYSWVPTIGITTTILFGLIFSILVNFCRKAKTGTDSRLFATPTLQLWALLFGEQYMAQWVIESDNTEVCKVPYYQDIEEGVAVYTKESSRKESLESSTQFWRGQKSEPQARLRAPRVSIRLRWKKASRQLLRARLPRFSIPRINLASVAENALQQRRRRPSEPTNRFSEGSGVDDTSRFPGSSGVDDDKSRLVQRPRRIRTKSQSMLL